MMMKALLPLALSLAACIESPSTDVEILSPRAGTTLSGDTLELEVAFRNNDYGGNYVVLIDGDEVRELSHTYDDHCRDENDYSQDCTFTIVIPAPSVGEHTIAVSIQYDFTGIGFDRTNIVVARPLPTPRLPRDPSELL